MKTNIKKLLSLLLVVAFVLTMIPVSGMMASAETVGSVYSTASGDYYVEYNSNAITLSADSTNGALVGEVVKDYSNTLDSALKVVTVKKYPILGASSNQNGVLSHRSSAFELAGRYGTAGGNNAIFGFVAADESYSIDNGDNCFAMYRTESGNATKFYVLVNGTTQVCYEKKATRARAFYIGTVEKDGSYYMSIDGVTIDGADYSAEVQEACMLENYFTDGFVANNGMVNFFYEADSMSTNSSGNDFYLFPNTHLENGVTVSNVNEYSDQNTPAIKTYGVDQAVTVSKTDDGNTMYTAEMKKWYNYGFNGIILNQSVNGGFKMSGDTARGYADQQIYYEFSNDPNFSDGIGKVINIKRSTANASEAKIGILGGTEYLTYKFYDDYENVHTFSFVEDESGATYLNIKGMGSVYGANITLTECDFTEMVKKPIYMRVMSRSGGALADGYGLKITMLDGGVGYDAITAGNADLAAVDENSSLSDINSALAAYRSSGLTAVNYDDMVKASELSVLYAEKVEAAAADFDAKVGALPAVEDLLYQDKAAVEALRAEYDALPDEAKTAVTTLDTLVEYESAVADIADNGYYRTSNGDIYLVSYDPANITLGSNEKNGAITATLIGTRSDEDTYLGILTTEKAPVLTGKYEVSQYFGTLDASGRFGITTSDDIDVFDRVQNNRFVLARMESGNTNTFYVDVDGVPNECYKVAGTTRVRLWTIGVAEENGSYYMTVDGVVINGADYSAEVQEALKLENYFDAEFLANNGMVNFFMHAKSMHGGAYLRPTAEVENGLLADVSDRITSPNSAVAGIVEYNVFDSSVSSDGTNTVYNFNVPSNGSVTVAEPIDPNGFSIMAVMDTASGNQNVKYSFSNDPTFTDGSEVEFYIYQFPNSKTNSVVYEGTERTDRFSGFYGGSVSRTLSFVEQTDGTYLLRVYTPGSDLTASAPDFSSLIGKPIYLKITGGAGINPVITLTNTTVATTATLPENAEDIDAAKVALDAFNADPARFTSYDALVKASELAVEIEAREMATELNERTAACNPEDAVNWFNSADEIKLINTAYGVMTAQQQSFVTCGADIEAMVAYINSLNAVTADNLVDCRKMLLGITEENITVYDYYNDAGLDIRDLVRMKKALSSKKA